MHRILPTQTRWPMFDVAQTRQIEQRAMAALPPHALMRRAGESVARLALAVAPHAQCVWVAAGPGNNGGDGLEAAIHLQRWGRHVEITLHGSPSWLPDDARDALERARAAGLSINPPNFTALQKHDIAIDALLGIGMSRAPEGALAASISQLNTLACPVLAVDVPSGLNIATGQPLGEACVMAAHTLALLTLKPGLFTAKGRDHAGVVWLDALAVDSDDDAPDAWLVGDEATASTVLAPRMHAQHKGSFGDVAVVGGAAGMTGAAWLAARAAHAAGAGRVYVNLLVAGDERASADLQHPELMMRSEWWNGEPEVLARTTVVCGCGGGDAVRATLPRLLSLTPRIVLDADALNAIAVDSTLRTLLRARADRQLASVLTPHPLEAARLLACSAAEVQSDRLRAAGQLAESLRCTVVLKGSGSLVATPGLTPCVNATGNASLATPGTGDVLAGWLGGLWAQSAAGPTPPSSQEVAVRAVADHGAAADAQGAGPLRAADLIEAMHRRLRRRA